MPEPIVMELCVYIMQPKLVARAYTINPSHQYSNITDFETAEAKPKHFFNACSTPTASVI
jgi:phosphoserine aminotransferase